jgi:indole-3-glycerol phosphate synthase
MLLGESGRERSALLAELRVLAAGDGASAAAADAVRRALVEAIQHEDRLELVAALDDALLRALLAAAAGFGMDALVEVHDAAELARALKLTSRLIGINNRDLKTFETTLAVSKRLVPSVPADCIVVGESGIVSPADLEELARVGISTFLVGESLMRERDVEVATRALIRRERRAGAAE